MQMLAASENADIPADAGLYNVEAEQALLGSLLVNNRMLDKINEHLIGEHFHDPLHGRIFDAINQRIRSGQGVSAVTLKSHFANDPALVELGGPRYFIRLAEAAFSISNAPDYATTIYELALRKLLIQLGDEIRHEAGNGASTLKAEEQIEQAERDLYNLGEKGRVERGFRPFNSLLVDATKQAERARDERGNIGLPTGLRDLDRVIGGLQNSDLVIIAGRTAMGKSALAGHIAFSTARHAAENREEESDDEKATREAGGRKRPRGILYFSLEMSAVQLTTRILAGQSHISSQRIARGELTDHEFGTFIQVANKLSELPLYLDDTPAMNIGTLCTRARRMKRQVGVAAIFVDYLQLIESSRRGENRVQQVTEVSQRLKGLAKELDVPVIALSQLSRQVETRDSKQPQLSDLRESGSIEQDADIVALLHREEYYLERIKPPNGDVKRPEWDAQMEQVENIAQLHIAKHRNGPTDTIELYFDRHYTTFRDLQKKDRTEPSTIDPQEF